MYESSSENKEECLKLLGETRKDITRLLEEGTIDTSSYDILNDRISEYVNEAKSKK